MGIDYPIRIGDVLEGKYEIVAKLGEGAMGLVFEGRHQMLNKRVAIKTLRTEISRDQGVIARFEQEARAASAIGHRNIIEVFDLGRFGDGAFFMVMEYLEGQDLSQLLQHTPFPTPQRISAIMSQVLSALAAAHRLGIVHRDLKPENIFLVQTETGECVKLLDFGISKVLENSDEPGLSVSASATRFGTVLGTPLYMSPEQARGLTNIDERADLWAAGCVFYECLCGTTPFTGENYNQILGSILQDAYPAPWELREDLPASVDEVITRALEKDRNLRYSNATEMRNELVAAMTGWPSEKEPQAETPPSSQEEEKLRHALDRLSLGAIETTGVDEFSGEQLQHVAPPSAPTTEPVPDSGSPELPPSQDLFAPPTAERQEPLLAPSIVPQPVRYSGTRPPSRNAPKNAPVYRRQKRRLAGTIKSCVFLVVLASAVFVGHRYYTLGYVLHPPVKNETAVQLQIQPTHATVLVNGETLTSRPFTAKVGVRYQFEFEAPGRLRMQETWTAQPKEIHEIAAILPFAIPRIDALSMQFFRSLPHPSSTQTNEQNVALMLEKLAAYAQCLEKIADPLIKSQRTYVASTPEARRINAQRLPVIQQLPQTAISQCRTNLTGMKEREPVLETLDSLSIDYLHQIDELVALLTRLHSYYDNSDFARDDFRLGRRSHRQVLDLFAKIRKSHQILGGNLLTLRMRWQHQELAQIESREGKTTHWYLRKLALASQSWVWVLRTKTVPQKNRAQALALLKGSYQHAVQYVQTQSAEPVIGAGAYLNAANALVKFADAPYKKRALHQHREEARKRHNLSIDKFNAMTLKTTSQ